MAFAQLLEMESICLTRWACVLAARRKAMKSREQQNDSGTDWLNLDAATIIIGLTVGILIFNEKNLTLQREKIEISRRNSQQLEKIIKLLEDKK